MQRRKMPEETEQPDHFPIDNDINSLLRQRPRLSTVSRYPPPKTTAAALGLFLGGCILFICGLTVYFKSSKGGDTGMPIFILGLISKLSRSSYYTFQ